MDVTGVPSVVMVVRLFAPWVGGMERQALRLAAELAQSGRADVRLVTGRWFLRTPRRETVEGVEVYRHAALRAESIGRGLRRVGALVYMTSLLMHLVRTRQSYDVIHVHGLSYHTAVCRVASRLTGRPMLVKLANSGDASDIAKMRRGQHLPGSRHLLGLALGAERYVALNATIVDELVAAGVDSARILRIPNGVQVPPVPPAPPPGSPPLRLVFVGRLHAQKDLATVLRGLGLLGMDLDVRLDVVGDGPERRYLEGLAGELELGDRVSFHGARTDVPGFLARADALVLSSRSEGLSNALLEAMAAGRAGIVSDIPGNVSLVEDGVDGFVFRTGDPVHLAEVMSRLAKDPTLVVSAGAAAHRKIASQYAIGSVGARYCTAYAEMIENQMVDTRE